jgi:hypothetical protein
MEKILPSIPAKRYFTIGEVGDLCGVKPHVLRYWEQEFSQLRPMKRRGNRRYYQHHEVLMIRRIRDLLYDQGFTISGARNKMQELIDLERDKQRQCEVLLDGVESLQTPEESSVEGSHVDTRPLATGPQVWAEFRQELLSLRLLLDADVDVDADADADADAQRLERSIHGNRQAIIED